MTCLLIFMDFGINYCEQGIQWVNAISSLSFLIAATALYYSRKKNIRSVLVVLIALTGIGSFVWHVKSTAVTFFLDSVPIALFLVTYTYFLVRNRRFGIAFTGLFAAILVSVSLLRPADAFFKGAQPYVVALVFMAMLLGNRNIRNKLMLPLISFAAALVFRQVDSVLCTFFPVGTHFMWHILVAIAVYYAVKKL